MTRIPTDEMRATPGFLPTSLRGPVVLASLFLVPGFVVVSALTIWLNYSRPGYFGPSWAVWILISFGALLFGGLVWFAGVGMTTYGISVGEEGITVYDRALHRGVALARTLSWDSLTPPQMQVGGRVWISGDALGTDLSLEEARTVLNDPRCPVRDRLPETVVRFLRR